MECLDTVLAQDRAPDELIVVAQAWDAGTIEAARSRGARVVEVGEPGLAQAIEAGLGGAASDVVAFIDDDARALPGWLRAIEARFCADARLGILGGRDNVGGDRTSGVQGSPVGLVRRGKIIGNHHRGTGAFRYVDHVKGANMSMLRAPASTVPLSALVAGQGAQERNEFVLSLAIQAQGLRAGYDSTIQVDHFPAARARGDERTEIDRARIRVRRANEAAAFTFARGGRTWFAYLLRTVLLGDRAIPGLILALGRRDGVRRFGASVRGILDGRAAGRALRTTQRGDGL